MKIEQVALFGAGSVGGSLLCRREKIWIRSKSLSTVPDGNVWKKKDCSPVGKHSFLKSGKKVLTLICSWWIEEYTAESIHCRTAGLCRAQYYSDAFDEWYFRFGRTAGSFSGKYSFDRSGLCGCQKNRQRIVLRRNVPHSDWRCRRSGIGIHKRSAAFLGNFLPDLRRYHQTSVAEMDDECRHQSGFCYFGCQLWTVPAEGSSTKYGAGCNGGSGCCCGSSRRRFFMRQMWLRRETV